VWLATEMTPMPYFPATFIPAGLSEEAEHIGSSSCSGRIWSRASFSSNQSHL